MTRTKAMLLGAYYRLARLPGLRHIHDQLRRRHHRRRYGVDCSHMFHDVEMEINSGCNRRCPYCPNVNDHRPPGRMEESLFRKIIDELGAMDFDGSIRYHFYGEPLLDKRLPEFVRLTKERVPQAYTEIQSNGDFLTLDVFRDYVARGLDHFLVTQHDNVIPPPLQEILDETSDEEKKHITIRLFKDRQAINRSGLIGDMQAVNAPLRIPCSWAVSIMIITMDGNVVLCCNDYYESEVLGNVKTQSLREVWASPRFAKLRRALARGDRTVSQLCHQCDFVPQPEEIARLIP